MSDRSEYFKYCSFKKKINSRLILEFVHLEALNYKCHAMQISCNFINVKYCMQGLFRLKLLKFC